MGEDFDGRVDVIPVSDPNIFSQSQRITMAQELLTMVQSNPEIHGPQGIYEAYRRMYSALGVDDVDSLIQPPPPPPQPTPVDAGIENSGFLMGQPAQAFEAQNHQAHIDAHRSLFLTDVVKQNPQLQGMIIGHMMQHLQFMAGQMVQDQISPELNQQIQEMQAAQQSGQVPPEQLQQMQSQIQMQIEQLSSPVLAQLTQELLESIGQGDDTDPLVQIRQQELMLKEKAIDSDSEQFEAKQRQRAEEKLLETEIAKQRLGIQKEVADDKLDVALRRLEQQAELKLLDIQNKNMGGR